MIFPPSFSKCNNVDWFAKFLNLTASRSSHTFELAIHKDAVKILDRCVCEVYQQKKRLVENAAPNYKHTFFAVTTHSLLFWQHAYRKQHTKVDKSHTSTHKRARTKISEILSAVTLYLGIVQEAWEIPWRRWALRQIASLATLEHAHIHQERCQVC